MNARRRPSNRPGFALIASLWLLVALSALGIELSLAAGRHRHGVQNAIDHTRATAVAQAGIQHARATLTHALQGDSRAASRLATRGAAIDPRDPWRHVGSTVADTTRVGDARYRLVVRDAGAALNLNLATEEELRRLLIALRIDAGRADRVAQSIADWRDADDFRRARGAERDTYLKEGAAALPSNGPFDHLEELLDVRGVTHELYDAARPYLTLAGSGRVNLTSAERPVLLALPGMSEEAVTLILRARRSPGQSITIDQLATKLSSSARAVILPELPRLQSRTTVTTQELEVRSEGWMDGARVHATIRVTMVRAGEQVILIGRRAE